MHLVIPLDPSSSDNPERFPAPQRLYENRTRGISSYTERVYHKERGSKKLRYETDNLSALVV